MIKHNWFFVGIYLITFVGVWFHFEWQQALLLNVIMVYVEFVNMVHSKNALCFDRCFKAMWHRLRDR